MYAFVSREIKVLGDHSDHQLCLGLGILLLRPGVGGSCRCVEIIVVKFYFMKQFTAYFSLDGVAWTKDGLKSTNKKRKTKAH